MAAKSTYWELLRRPEWQEKRLRIMDRAGFKCQSCGDCDTILNVHHRYYTKGAKPWEYPDEALECLCETCHGELHEIKSSIDQAMATLGIGQLKEILGYITAMNMLSPRNGHDTKFTVGSYEEAWALVLGVADPKVDPYCLIDLMDGPGLTRANIELFFSGIDPRTPKFKATEVQ